ncbi:endolytic transglycosylase MltG [Brevundimonas sp. 2R-24]|uniref:Endolytic murein transglycosylase n=1 Tax=Peiella sedimenti TaxID=3061083 RepID=A0ABT8SIF5_9CAUL|nr:endolytic transglycosylase MltG [Caulobacteraceae bacterium XZ-24]
MGPIRGGGPSTFLAGLFGAGVTLVLLLLAALAWGYAAYSGPGPEAREGEETIVVLRSGSGVSEIGQTLEAAGVIRSADAFRVAATVTGADRSLRAGEYRFPSEASLRDVIGLLRSGRVVRHFVTLPEGRSVAQAMDILMAEDILTGDITDIPPEGTLWPETYEITRGEERMEVIQRMRREHEENLARLWAQRDPTVQLANPQEALILASIVEKETGVAAERPRIAAVFLNRLRIGMRLETDPTVIYGVTQGRPLGRGLRLSELRRDTPYNTYLRGGLPPTPIANPGEAALRAVLRPPRTDELFFVADGTGGHVFARTYEEHLQNVARWREIERNRGAAARAAGEVTGEGPDRPDEAAPAAADAS